MDPSRRGAKYGRGEYSIDAGAVAPSAQDVILIVQKMLSEANLQPPMLPSSAVLVRKLSGLSRVEVSDVVPVLEWDPLLAASAMRVALVATPEGDPPPTLRATVDLLGLSNISTLAFGTVFKSHVFRDEHYGDALEQIRQHSVATAQVAGILARGTAAADYAFTCGLLHEIGASVTVLALARNKVRVPIRELGSLLCQVHEQAGAELVDAWKLSSDLKRGIDGHHFPRSREGALVRVADAIATECGYGAGLGAQEYDNPHGLKSACALIKLTPEGYAQVLDIARAEFRAQRAAA